MGGVRRCSHERRLGRLLGSSPMAKGREEKAKMNSHDDSPWEGPNAPTDLETPRGIHDSQVSLSPPWQRIRRNVHM